MRRESNDRGSKKDVKLSIRLSRKGGRKRRDLKKRACRQAAGDKKGKGKGRVEVDNITIRSSIEEERD